MGFFGIIVDNIKLKRRINQTYVPYLKRLATNLHRIVEIESNIPEEITQIYNEILSNTKKFREKISLYSHIDEIAEHNLEVKRIISHIENFSKDSALEEFENYANTKLNEDIEIYKLIEKYDHLEEKYVKYANLIRDFYENRNEIVLCFLIKKEYDKLLDLKNIYYDLNLRQDFLHEISSIKDKIQNNKYYNFDRIDKPNEIINDHNKEYVERNLNMELFNDINGRSLDEEQRKAVLRDDVAALTIAGAGSGKTLTICGKVKYLIEKKNVNPNDILLLSYSKKSADDLEAKVKKISEGLEVGTFHKIGLSILMEKENKHFMIEEQYTAIIEKYFREDLVANPDMMRKVLIYYSLYLNSNMHKKYEDDGKKFEELKGLDYTTMKSMLLDMSNDTEGLETIKKEYVKSYEELMIANFYFINGINYTYEKPYEVDTSTPSKRQYTPDFYLEDYNIYHEHYGIDKNGEANQYKGLEAIDYIESIRWKRNTHLINNTKCIESYSFEFDEGNVFDKLKYKLEKSGVKLNPLSNEEISNALNSIYESMNFKSFITLIRSFISLYKSRYPNITKFDELKKESFENEFERQRASMFIDICKDVYKYYINYLEKEGKIDFDDMILKSMNYLPESKNYRYKYIIVDEFQDISYSRMLFLKSLIKHGDSKLFAVGDDWQAIYRFSGCDLNIFLNFSKYFGESVINYITSTHRNSQELQDIAGPFIKQNSEQINKTIKSSKHLEKPVKLIYYDEKRIAFYKALQEIYLKDKNANILVLGRNNKDIEKLLSNRLFFDRKKNDDRNSLISLDYKGFNIRYTTVHSSKGLEEDYVIIINAEDSKLGFPNKVEDDPLLNLVLSSNSSYEYAEERRLWYVALTRTRSYTYILVNSSFPSKFVEEIKEKCEIINGDLLEDVSDPVLCPYCKSGRLVLRTDGTYNGRFYGCSNYPYCNYSINDFRAVDRNLRCKKCGDIMIYRKGKWGAFYGCHSYPRCNYTEEYNKSK